MRSRVTPGTSCTTAARRPRNRLTRVDLPTFGRPTMATTGSGPEVALAPAAPSLTRTHPPDRRPGQLDDAGHHRAAVQVGAVDHHGVLRRAERAVGAAAVVLVAAPQVGGQCGDLVRIPDPELGGAALGAHLR